MRLGLALPCFVDDPEIPIAVARRADDVGLDGVFVYDHLWRDVPPPRRGALECFALLGAIAAETERVHVGTLVARATLRPAATLAHGFDTVQRVSSGRLIAGIGAGDSQTRDENEAFGLPFGTLVSRVEALLDAVDAARGRGYSVWVAGHLAAVRETVARADGWNTWGVTPERFAADAALVREVAPNAITTWGGLALLGRDDDHASDKLRGRRLRDDVAAGGPARVSAHLRAYAARGAAWAVVAPLDASDPENAEHLARVASRLEREPAASVPAVEQE
jgi:alkanesulfonate monooxygenase SsuD/methylene tetrahydromethanopterin reductase-like flavin-dependent oxidoreductase (luciferase family)